MARISIDDELHADPRFKRLSRKLGNEDLAVGLLYRFWRLAQDYWADESLIPIEEFEMEELEVLRHTGFAELRDAGYYASGSEDRFAWYLQRCRAGKERSRAERDKLGQFTKTHRDSNSDGTEKVSAGEKTQRDSIPHQPSLLSAPFLSDKEKKEERPTQNLNDHKQQLVDAWARTLEFHKLDAKAEWDAEPILRLLQRYRDPEQVRRALIGARFEPDYPPTFVAKQHLSARRLLDNPKLFEKCVKWGSGTEAQAEVQKKKKTVKDLEQELNNAN